VLKNGEIYFNGNTSIGLNLFLEEYPSVPIANEDFEEITVEGRSGSLYINKGTYPDKKIPFNFTILSPQIEIDFDKVYQWLTEIQDKRLIFGREDRCYIVKKVLFENLQKQFKTIGQFKVTFICEPFSSDLNYTTYEITSDNYSFYYQGNAPAESLIKVYGIGNIQLTINGETMVIYDVTDYVEIDSKFMQVRNKDKTSKDSAAYGVFPLFSAGANTIKYTGNVTKIIVEYTTRYK